MATKKRSAKEAWEAIQKAAEDEEIRRAVAETPEEVDAGLRALGMDPEKVRAKGKALGERLIADRKRLAWQVQAAEGLARDRAAAKAREGRYAGLDRGELMKRLEAARNDPRLAQRATFMFRNHAPDEATDEQLRGMLEDLDALIEGKKKGDE